MSHIVRCNMSRFMCHVSCVMCHVSHVTCHMSHVTCHLSRLTFHMIFFILFCSEKKIEKKSHLNIFDKMVELVGGGSVINGAYPVLFLSGLDAAVLTVATFTLS